MSATSPSSLVTDVKRVYWSLAPLSRAWISTAITLGLCDLVGLVPAHYFALDWIQVGASFQLWRLVTTFLYHGSSLSLVTSLLLIGQFVDSVEHDTVAVELLTFLAFNASILIFLSLFLYLPFLASPLLVALLVLYADTAPNQTFTVNLLALGRLELRRWLLPIVLFLPWLIVGESFLSFICGVISGGTWLIVMRWIPTIYAVVVRSSLNDWHTERIGSDGSIDSGGISDSHVSIPMRPMVSMSTQTSPLASSRSIAGASYQCALVGSESGSIYSTGASTPLLAHASSSPSAPPLHAV